MLKSSYDCINLVHTFLFRQVGQGNKVEEAYKLNLSMVNRKVLVVALSVKSKDLAQFPLLGVKKQWIERNIKGFFFFSI